MDLSFQIESLRTIAEVQRQYGCETVTPSVERRFWNVAMEVHERFGSDPFIAKLIPAIAGEHDDLSPAGMLALLDQFALNV